MTGEKRQQGSSKDHKQEEREFAFLAQRYEKRKFWRKQPKTGSQIISQLLAKKGYGQTSATETVDEQWKQAVGESLSSKSKPGVLRRGVLEIIVHNSSVMQELVFQKRQILKRFKTNDQTKDITDLKFKVGAT